MKPGEAYGAAVIYNNVAYAMYRDKIVPGALNEQFRNKSAIKLPFLWNHDVGQPLGAAYLRLSSRGVEATMSFNLETQNGREKFPHAKNGEITGLSIGFVEFDATPEKDPAHGMVRVIKGLWIHELSMITLPADPACVIERVGDSLAHPDIPHSKPFTTADALSDPRFIFNNSLFASRLAPYRKTA